MISNTSLKCSNILTAHSIKICIINMQPNKSSLNADTIPDTEYLNLLSKYHPKICSDLIKDIASTQGMISSDDKVYKTMSIAAERLILKILKQVREANSKSQKEGTIKELITNKDMVQALEVSIL